MPYLIRTTASLALFTLALTGCSRNEAPPAGTAGASAAAEGSLGTVYITNEMSGDVSVVDLATERVVATIAVGKRPRGLNFSRDGSLLYVALSGSPIAPPGVDESTLPPADKSADGIGVIDVRARRLLRVIPGGSDPEVVDVSADGRLLFVANEDAGIASAIEAGTGKVIAEIPVGGEPEGVDVRPDGAHVYVTSEEDNTVAVIDAAAPRLIRRLEVGARPRSTTFLPDSSRAYIPGENSGDVRVFDTATFEQLAVIPLSGELQRPMSGVASPDGRFVYMTTGRGKTVAIIDTAANQHVGSIEVGERPWGIALSDDGRVLVTANGPSNDISIVDTQARQVKARVKVGDRPWGVAFAR